MLYLFILIIVAIMFLCNVPKTISTTDKYYIQKIFSEAGITPSAHTSVNFDEEIKHIINIQAAVFKRAPGREMIPYGLPREPENLYNMRAGYCCDRARTMDKAMRLAGFPSRYVSVYRRHPDYNFFQSLFLTNASAYKCHSHALIEVKTSQGWIAVDTRHHWISLSADNAPLRLREMRHIGPLMDMGWSDKNTEPPYDFFQYPFYIIYGLYSRHGKFYPPFIPMLPNVNWGEMLENFKA